MNDYGSWNTSVTIPHPSSSSSPRSPYDAVSDRVIKNNGGGNGEEKTSFPSWLITVFSMLLAGVVAYYTALMATHEKIAVNKERISVVETKLDSISSDMELLEEVSNRVIEIDKDVALNKKSLESLQSSAKRKITE